MNKDDFIKSLDIPYEGSYQGDEYVIILSNSNQYSEVYNKLLYNEDLTETNQSITSKETKFTYTDGYYEVNISADYDNDEYIVIIGDR